jgi:DNA-binding NarL/FixJ family response regulator
MSMTGEALEAGDHAKLRVLIVDDHDVVHWGFRLMLGNQPWVERTLSARSGSEAYALATRYKPDVALVDLFIGEESGPEICQQLRERSPSTNVLLISGAGKISAGAAKAAGASGFIPKDWGATDIASAVRMVGLGMTVFQPQADAGAQALTAREQEVLDLMARGSTNREIADALHLSPHTIHEHTSSLYRKLGARNRADAVQRASRNGLID